MRRMRVRLGEMLLQAGVITSEQLASAVAEQKKWGGKLGHLLVEMGFVQEDLLVKALSQQLGYPRVDFDRLVVAPEALRKLDGQAALKNLILPIAYDASKKRLLIALADPENINLVQEIEFVTGCRVQIAIAGERGLALAIRKFYFDQALATQAEMVLRPPEVETEPEEEPVPAAQAGFPGKTPDLAEQVAALEEAADHQRKLLQLILNVLLEKQLLTREEYWKKIRP